MLFKGIVKKVSQQKLDTSRTSSKIKSITSEINFSVSSNGANHPAPTIEKNLSGNYCFEEKENPFSSDSYRFEEPVNFNKEYFNLTEMRSGLH